MIKTLKGFTLIEVIVCLAIVGIIAALVIPSSRIIADTRLKTTAKTLLTDIRFVKDMTCAMGVEYKITFNSNGYIISRGDLGIVREYAFDKGITLEDYEINRGTLKVNYLTYTYDGAPSASGTLTLSNRNKQVNISIVPVTGRAAVTSS